jgi:hypothetical protein
LTEEQVVGGTEVTPPGSPPEPPTPEQVEAEWKHRVSQKDKAHAAETKNLRDQIAALSGVASTAEQTATGSLSEAEALRQQLATAQKTLQQKDAEHAAQLRTIRFPNAAEALDASALAAMDEAKLAGLEARLSAPAPRGIPIDPSTPPRAPSGGGKPIEEKTSAELREDLRRMAPQIIAEMGRQPD